MSVQINNGLGLNSEEVTGATKTLDEGDNGVVQVVTVDSTITLPATSAGATYTIMNGGQGATDGSITVNVSPNASDKIMGNGFTSADDKDAINTDGQYGAYLKLVGDGADGWVIVESAGTWTLEA